MTPLHGALEVTQLCIPGREWHFSLAPRVLMVALTTGCSPPEAVQGDKAFPQANEFLIAQLFQIDILLSCVGRAERRRQPHFIFEQWRRDELLVVQRRLQADDDRIDLPFPHPGCAASARSIPGSGRFAVPACET